MQIVKLFFFTLTTVLLLGSMNASAVNSSTPTKAAAKQTTLRDPAQFQKIIDDYKTYLATISPQIRDEVIQYRKQVAEINKSKKMLYKKLSQEAQSYLKEERKYKKTLPLNRKKLIRIKK